MLNPIQRAVLVQRKLTHELTFLQLNRKKVMIKKTVQRPFVRRYQERVKRGICCGLWAFDIPIGFNCKCVVFFQSGQQGS